MSTYKQNKDVIFRQEEDEAIIFNPDNSDILVLNSTGCFIWSLLDKKTTKDKIWNKIIDEFEVASGKAKKDLDKFIGELETKGFIKKS
jgi:hypothetical protein